MIPYPPYTLSWSKFPQLGGNVSLKCISLLGLPWQYHRMGDLNNRNLFSYSFGNLEAWDQSRRGSLWCKRKVVLGLSPWLVDGHLPVTLCCLSSVHICVQVSFFFVWVFLFCFIFWPCCMACEIFVPRPGIEPRPQQWTGRVLTTGLPGNSLCPNFL